jgi:hypothetical protein
MDRSCSPSVYAILESVCSSCAERVLYHPSDVTAAPGHCGSYLLPVGRCSSLFDSAVILESLCSSCTNRVLCHPSDLTAADLQPVGRCSSLFDSAVILESLCSSCTNRVLCHPSDLTAADLQPVGPGNCESYLLPVGRFRSGVCLIQLY